MTLQNYQQVLFELPESQLNQSESLQAAFLANLTLFLDCVWHLMMTVTCGTKTGESLARLTPGGTWEKMYQGYCQASLDGSLVEFSEIWPRWGIALDGVASALKIQVPSRGGKGIYCGHVRWHQIGNAITET